jgi:hypothetical protein
MNAIFCYNVFCKSSFSFHFGFLPGYTIFKPFSNICIVTVTFLFDFISHLETSPNLLYCDLVAC